MSVVTLTFIEVMVKSWLGIYLFTPTNMAVECLALLLCIRKALTTSPDILNKAFLGFLLCHWPNAEVVPEVSAHPLIISSDLTMRQYKV